MSAPYYSGTFVTRDGFKLFEQHWYPLGDAIGSVVLVHGIAEHSNRYEHVARFLNERGYAVFAYDHQGHGQSEGRPIYIDSFDVYSTDLGQMALRVRQLAPTRPLYVLGHSMGGLILAYWLVTSMPKIDGALFSGAALKAGDDVKPIEMKIAPVLSRLLPKLEVTKLSSDSISRDPEVVRTYDNDPMVYRGGIPARTGAEMLRAISVVTDDAMRLEYPMLVMHGTADKITNIEGSMQFHARVSSAEKTLKLYDGLYHEILNEPEKETVLNDIGTWLDAQVAKRSTTKKSHHQTRGNKDD